MAREAFFAAGCFWGVETAFRAVPGIRDVEVGYMGGTSAHPTYEEVCSGTTGHAESVRVVFDPDLVTYESLVRVFFRIHDPTTLNRQGPDVGSQYRSTIFYRTQEEKEIALRVQAEEGTRRTTPIVTTLEQAGPFYRAEEYHQRYFEKQGGGICRI